MKFYNSLICFKLTFILIQIGFITNVANSVSLIDTNSRQSDTYLPTHGKCEVITVDQCKDLEYNQTIMPNVLNQLKQSEAKESMMQYSQLIQYGCSQYIQIFLCSVFVPVCTMLENALPPCRSLCLNSKSDCEPMMKKAGFGWPDELDCSKFPVDHGLCVNVNGSKNDPNRDNRKNRNWQNKNTRLGNEGSSRQGPRELFCPTFMRANVKYDYKLLFGDSVMKNCGMPCGAEGDIFSISDKRKLVRLIICIVACICLLSSLFTFLTFLVDTRRFRYPERPIVFISACYCVIAVAYIIAYALDDKISCSEFIENFVDEDISFKSVLVTQGTKKEGCTIIFVMLYFCTLASCIWWVILTLTWFLSAGLKWGQEAVESRSQYFHLVAWAIPGVMTIVLLAMGQVDGDALTGICNTGLTNGDIAKAFVAGPLIILLSVGIFFLLAGFFSLCRVRSAMKFDGNRTDKLEKLMVRIGVYALLYVVPVAFVVGCVFYEHAWRTEWVKGWYHRTCSNLMAGEGQFGNMLDLDYEMNYLRNNVILQQQQWACGNYPPHFADYAGTKPDLTIFVLKHLMTLIVGVACGFWVCSGKTAESWSKFFCRSSEADKKIQQKGQLQPALL